MNYSLSYWERETFFKDVDVAILGGGIVGLNAAIHLISVAPSLRVAVIDRSVLPLGASTRNAGFACFGSVSELLEDLLQRTEEEVWNLVRRRYQGLKKLRSLLHDDVLEYVPCGGYELFRQQDEALYEKCADNLWRFNSILKDVTGIEQTFAVSNQDFGFAGVRHLIFNQAEGQLNTGKMMQALIHRAQHLGIIFFNGLPIDTIETQENKVNLITRFGWDITVKRVLLATNGFTRQLYPALDVKPARNQVLITQPIPSLRLRGTFHYDAGYYYFRNVGNRVLLGGGRNLDFEGEETPELGHTRLVQEALLHLLRQVILPDTKAEVDTWWSGVMGIGGTKTPILEELEKNVFAAVRMGGMGVAIGSLVGEEAARMVLDSL